MEHPATRANVALLRERGVVVLEPDSGRLTGADTGPGRLPEPPAIHAAALALLAGGAAPGRARDLVGRRVVVSAGGTREPIDPVRFLANSSSGKQGFALAATAAARGAEVVLVAANTALPAPAGVELVPVGTALELRDAVRGAAATADAVVMAAAVADFRPRSSAATKIKKSADDDAAPVIELVRNPDVLAELVADRRAGAVPAGAVLVGFAAETGDADGGVLDHGRAKLARKGCDVVVVNEVGAGRGFGTDDATVVLLERDAPGDGTPVGPAPKAEVAQAIWDVVVRRLSTGPR